MTNYYEVDEMRVPLWHGKTDVFLTMLQRVLCPIPLYTKQCGNSEPFPLLGGGEIIWGEVIEALKHGD